MTTILEEFLQDMLDDMEDMRRDISLLRRRESRQRHLNAGKIRELTIAAGVITVRSIDSFIELDTQSDAATDDLDTISGGVEGQIIVIRSSNLARVPTIKHDADNLSLAKADFLLSNPWDRIILINEVSRWFEISRSDNA